MGQCLSGVDVMTSPSNRQLFREQRNAILAGDAETAVALAREAIRDGVDLAACIDEGYVAGIQEVGRLWAEGEYFLPELVQGADAMKAAMAVLRPAFPNKGNDGTDDEKILLGTVEGDIHDIGKALVATVLEANGFPVVDLGRDVPDDVFVEKIHSEGARVLGMSALLTTTMINQGRVIERLEREGIRDRILVIVGGAPVTRSFAEEIGADAYAANAMDALAEVRRLVRPAE
jgi:corrinoid protein of di/trimethylamine methyltransferase